MYDSMAEFGIAGTGMYCPRCGDRMTSFDRGHTWRGIEVCTSCHRELERKEQAKSKKLKDDFDKRFGLDF